MKKFIVAAFALALSSTALLADDPGDVRFSVYGGAGLTRATGDIPEGEESQFSAGYLGGLNMFYSFTSQFSLLGGAEYAYKKLRFEEDGGGSFYFEQSFYNLMIGGRFMNFEALYVDLGFYAGIPAGDVKWHSAGTSGTIDDKYVKNEYGMFFGIGYLFPIAETLDFNIGLGMKAAFTPALDFEDSNYNSHIGYIKAGLDFKF